jgi:hypothetical protein
VEDSGSMIGLGGIAGLLFILIFIIVVVVLVVKLVGNQDFMWMGVVGFGNSLLLQKRI